MMIRNICCIGGGAVGGPNGCFIAWKCPDIKVNIVDTSETRIKQWNSDQLPIYEHGLDEIVKECRGRNLFFSNDINESIREADLIFISVNAPVKNAGSGIGRALDLRYVESTARNIAEVAEGYKIIIEKSSVPVRAAESIRNVLAANSKLGSSFEVLSNPSFCATGTAIQDMLNPDRILIGGDETSEGKQAIEALMWVYCHWVPKERILTTNIWSAELSKLASNAFLAQRVSSINAMSAICEATGADVSQIAMVVGQDSRIGPKFLEASVGFGGACFEKDLLNIVYMAESLDLCEVAVYWQNVLNINEYQKSRFTRKIIKCLFNTVADKKIAIFGFSFKNDTSDTRGSPAINVCTQLLEEGSYLNIYDPKVPQDKIRNTLSNTGKSMNRDNISKQINVSKSPYEATFGVHAIVLLTDWTEFNTYDYKKMHESMQKPAYIFDGSKMLDHGELLKIGFHVKTIGKCFM